MKRIFNIALTALLALSFAACSEDDPFLGQPVVNPQLPVMPADGIEASDIIAQGGSADLQAAGSQGFIDVLDITRLKDFPADQQLNIVMTLSPDQSMQPSQDITLTTVEGGNALYTAKAAAADWDQVFKAIVSRDPSAKTMYATYTAYAVQGTTSVLLGSVGAKQAISVTPFGYEHPLENEYFIYGTACGNVIADALKLSHEGNVYDNPVFKVKVDITSDQIAADGGWKFKVIPLSTKQAAQTWDQNHSLTFIGAANKAGELAYATASADVPFVVIDKPGSYMLNVNLLDLTYELTNAIDYIYVPGANNDWSSWSTKLPTTDYIHYDGYANLTGDFKFTGTNGWSADFGNYGADGGNNYKLLNGSNDNFKLDGTAGLYYINLNLGDLTYKKTLITKVSVVGSHNGWDAANAPMLQSDDNLVWIGEVTLNDGDEFKFNMNGAWDINLGGEMDNLQQNGSNLRSPGAGTYLIALDLSTPPYQCLIEKQ